MRRPAAFGGSILIHAAVGLALIGLRAPDETRSTERASIELVDVDPASLVELVDVTSLSSGGGGSSGAPKRDAGAPSSLIASASPPRTRRLAIVRATPTDRSLSDSLAEIATTSHVDREFLDGKRTTENATSSNGAGASNSDNGDGGGRGGGHGNGIGRGVGAGLGDLAAAGERLPAPPAAPKASKARPAKLIYPSRDRPVEDDAELFVARVTVDRDGFVVGARLTKGPGGPKRDEAAGLIFRFRYAPALDDDGHPIKSHLDQPFLVEQ